MLGLLPRPCKNKPIAILAYPPPLKTKIIHPIKQVIQAIINDNFLP